MIVREEIRIVTGNANRALAEQYRQLPRARS